MLKILSGNHFSNAVALNDLCDLEIEVKVTQFKLGLHLALVLLCTKFGEDTSYISSDIERKPFFTCHRLKMTSCDLENKVKVTRFKFGLHLPWCFCVPNLVRVH